MELKQKAALIYNAIEDKKGSRISVLDISKISVMADYFIIADAENSNQLQAIVDNVEEQMMKNGNHCRIEGKAESGWMLLDFSDIIVHIFNKEDRLFYDLERLWRDAVSLSKEQLGVEEATL
jgi:ribosome-associated protein